MTEALLPGKHPYNNFKIFEPHHLFISVILSLTVIAIVTLLAIEQHLPVYTPPDYSEAKAIISETEAIAKVAALPEVQQWMNSNDIEKPTIILDHFTGNKYYVYVYRKNGMTNSTLGWYEVDMVRGTVTNVVTPTSK